MNARLTKPILVVDDEPILLSIVESILTKQSYVVYTASSAQEALDILADHEIAVVISDYKMPGDNGIDFLERVRMQYSDIVRIIMTGYAEVQVAIDAINRAGVFRFLEKPWDQEEFYASVQTAIEAHGNRKFLC
jgi:DNA-binding NtrC family response regulator